MVSYDVLIFHEFNSKTHLLTDCSQKSHHKRRENHISGNFRHMQKSSVMISCDGLFFHFHNGKTGISHAQKMWDTHVPNNLISQQHQTDLKMGDKLLVSLLFIICFLQQQNSPKPLTHQSSCQSQITRKFVISHTHSPAAKLTYQRLTCRPSFQSLCILHTGCLLLCQKTYEKVILDGTNAAAIVGT